MEFVQHFLILIFAVFATDIGFYVIGNMIEIFKPDNKGGE